MVSSQALLDDYVQNGSEQAFRDLVEAYVNFVFSTALRVVGGDRHLAEDVVQTVFTDLARKAALLPKEIKLGGWLHRHTCFVGRKILRREHRRRVRERRALEMQAIQDHTAENLGQVAGILDEAINSLSSADRTAIVLRFFEQLDFRSVGKALGSSEDAARMRVSRAVEKLGAVLRHRGIAVSFAGVGYILSNQTVSAAPLGLTAAVCKLALGQGIHQMGTLALLKEICVTKLNVALMSSAAAIAIIATVMAASQSTQVVRHPEPEIEQVVAAPELVEGEPSIQPPVMAATAAAPEASSPQVIPETVSEPQPASPRRTVPAVAQIQPAKPAPVTPPTVSPSAPTTPVASVPFTQPIPQSRAWPKPAPEVSLAGNVPRWQRNWELDRSQVLSFSAPPNPLPKVPIAPQNPEKGRSTVIPNPPGASAAKRGPWRPATVNRTPDSQ